MIEPWCAELERASDWPAMARALDEIVAWSAEAADPTELEAILRGVLGVTAPPADALEAELHATILRDPAWRCVRALHVALERVYAR